MVSARLTSKVCKLGAQSVTSQTAWLRKWGLLSSSRFRSKLCLAPTATICTNACSVEDRKVASQSPKLFVPHQFDGSYKFLSFC